ncbi:hypothetical protein A1O3_00596 [Capronia epimyces CBS 606.96]|uniref:Uncharacterized protein n=1 Tax=Capronia epimyces CBS 606.96 TaxID=1182542 RepID=W9YS12_9EURO|nr:uncharacterized protein A1O3_00596 [Capronia epimyces CBS 606.96]EXJ92046.1 hypothetical protein A1O3_00596 [Capronia epimyces CBS 606.96]
MSVMDIDSIWQSAFGDSTRPELYTSEELNEDGFQPLNDPQAFLLNITTLGRKQLYAASANNQIAMQQAQDEYLDLERQIANLKGKNHAKNPQALPEQDVFNERKEAALYNYKYDPNRPALLHAGIPGLRHADDLTEREKHEVRLFQEPFEQGGFVPKEREYKAKLANARNPKNIDGWVPVVKDGKSLIPKLQTHHDEYNITYVRRNVDENGEIIRPQTPTSEVSGEAPSKPVDKRLTRTRFDGKKHPPTREVSEVPSSPSTPGQKRANTPAVDGGEDTPNAKRQRLNTQSKPKQPHPNQYTKAREAQESAMSTSATEDGPASGTAKTSWEGLSPASLRARKWTDEELVEAVKHDHLWLHDDPDQAEDWKEKIINGVNPVRSFSMFKKWAYWKAANKDKRPRGKKNLPDNQPDETSKPKRAPTKPKARSANGRIILPTAPIDGTIEVLGARETVKRAVGTKKEWNRSGQLEVKHPLNHDEAEEDQEEEEEEKGKDDDHQPLRSDMEMIQGSRTQADVSWQNDTELNDSLCSRASLKQEESDSITVDDITPPKRRSLRKTRRTST